MKTFLAIAVFLICGVDVAAQKSHKKFPLTSPGGLQAVHVLMQPAIYENKKSMQVIDTARQRSSETMFAKLSDLQFQNGTIEVELAGKPLTNAEASARGFVGIAFRINEADSHFECIYLRPANGRAEDQVRRNHSVQYISHPGYPWEKLRKETPERYETYVDLEVGKWTKVKIEVVGSAARLYVHGASQPTLIVSDLKQGDGSKGSIGLWIGPGTEAYFRNLIITNTD
ncbi:MAG: hypothetical protein ACO1NX_11015 [Chitinophagaceae bacterium]